MNTVIYHRADFDGLFSAAVCRKFLPDARFYGWDFGDEPLPFPGEGALYIVDLSPDCLSDSQVAVAAHSHRLVWIDHHKSSIEKWNQSIPGYRVDGVAACRLAWAWFLEVQSGKDPSAFTLPTKAEFVERAVSEPLALTLAGEYDVWDLRDSRSLPFQYGLTMMDGVGFSHLLRLLESDEATKSVAGEGQYAQKWQQIYARQIAVERGYSLRFEGLEFLALGSPHARSSQWFPNGSVPESADALMCWRYDGKRVLFSLYHAPGHEDLDLSQIAVKYGGGGHRGACGFSMSLDDALAVIR